jgi:hypothetical protein
MSEINFDIFRREGQEVRNQVGDLDCLGVVLLFLF